MNEIRHSDQSVIVRRLSMIPWAYIATLVVLFATELSISGARITGLLLLTLMMLPWIVGAIMLTWSEGPAKNWSVKLTVSLSFMASLCYAGVILTRMARFLGASPVVFAGVFVAFPMVWYLLFLVHMRPKQCPGCGVRGLIPLLQLVNHEKRSANTRWCAACGGKYWKDRSGTWQKERRLTWHDEEENVPESSGGDRPGIAAPVSLSKNKASQASPTTKV